MPDEARPIFRHDALRQYVEGREKAVLPRFLRPRIFIFLWILLGFLLLAGVLGWAARVPVYASGVAVVTRTEGKVVLAVLVPAESLDKLAAGQTVWVRWPATREPAKTLLTDVEPEVQSPAVVRRRFGLSSETVSGAVAVAAADPEGVLPAAGNSTPEAHLGSTVSVDVEVGSRRALSLLPALGEWLR